MSINGQGHSLTLVKGHSDFKVKCLTFGLYTQVSNSGPLGPLVFYSPDSLSEIYSDISCTLLGVNFTFCMQFTGEITSVVVEINMIGLY